MTCELLRQFGSPRSPNALAVRKLQSWLGKPLPGDLEAMLTVCDGWRGYWNSESFLDLWGADSIRLNNEAYRVREYAPEVLLIGSDGCGEALAYQLAIASSGDLFQVPFVGLSLQRMVRKASSLGDYLAGLGPPTFSPAPAEKIEIVELKPVLFGGEPTDQKNKSRLTRSQHIEFVNFWNKLLVNVKPPDRAADE